MRIGQRVSLYLVPGLIGVALCIVVHGGIGLAAAPADTTGPQDRDARVRSILQRAIDEADQIAEERARTATQWHLVQPLVELGTPEQALKQALKLRNSDPQMCIYSLTAIGLAARRAGDTASVDHIWKLARDVNSQNGKRFDHYLIELGFKLRRPLAETLAVAAEAAPESKINAFRDIRDQCAARGRVDEAYRVAQTHLTTMSRELHDREIAYRCASAEQLVPDPAPDHFEQAIRILKQMPAGKHRDFVIGALVENLLIAPHHGAVPDARLALAQSWAGEIQDELGKARAKKLLLLQRLPKLNAEEAEQQFATVASREEKDAVLLRLFQLHLEAGQLEAADAILPRRIQLVREQPRPESRGKFGNFNDDDAVRTMTWIHEQQMIRALVKAGRRDDARFRLEAVSEALQTPPTLFLPNPQGIRLSLLLELEDFDSYERLVSQAKEPWSRSGGTASLAAILLSRGRRERALTLVQHILEMPAEQMFPANAPWANLAAEPYRALVSGLIGVDRWDDALSLLTKIPERDSMRDIFVDAGRKLIETGHDGELDRCLERLPHHLGRANMCFGAIDALRKASPPPTCRGDQ